MKVVFAILLILSLAFFSFMQWGDLLTGGGKNGQTLPDLNAAKIKLIEPIPLKSSAVPVTQAVHKPAAVSAPVSTTTVVASAPLPIEAATPAKAIASAVIAASAPVVVQPPKNVPIPLSVVKARPGKTCMEWGEFSGIDLARATKVLAEMKLGDKLSQRTVEYTSGYWVYIKPLKTRADANKKIAQLKALGVEEYFVVQERGKWFNAISLGVFKTSVAANNYLARLNKKGVHSVVVGTRNHKLKFTVFVLNNIDVTTRTQLNALHKYFPGSELSINACN